MQSKYTQAVLMAGGKGTRLRPFTNILPKPLVPLGEISIIEMVLKQLNAYGFRDIIISVGYKAELIMAIIGSGDRFNLNVRYHNESEPLGTVGALASISNLEDNFIVMNGDICTNMNFMKLFKFHLQRGAAATIGAYKREEKLELGVLEVDKNNNKIYGFIEKPVYHFLVSMGVNAFHKSILDLIPLNKCFGFDDLMHKMLKEKINPLYYLFEGFWFDIGRPDDYNQALQSFSENLKEYLPKGIE